MAFVKAKIITKGRTVSGSTRVCRAATRLFTAEFKSDA